MGKTTQQIAKMHINDYAAEAELDKKAKLAMKQAKEEQKVYKPSKLIPVIDTEESLDNLKDYRVNVKLENIGRLARITEAQKTQQQSIPTDEADYLKRKQNEELRQLD